jgi:peptide/nickel transport system substrate-binding protein
MRERYRVVAVAGLASFAVACASGCTRQAAAPANVSARLVTVTDERFTSAFTRNFNPFMGASRWPTRSGIYEPLLVYNVSKGTYVPWLATSYEWKRGNMQLGLTLRKGVSWSDGQPFTARDVTFTFDVMRRHPLTDVGRIWDFLKDVRTADGETVEFEFQRPFSPGLRVIGEQPIAPEHIFKDVDPTSFANENPVATGPFTEIRSFSPTLYEVTRNERYWQRERVKIPGFRVPLFRNNGEAIAALMAGEVDWGSIFIPNAENTFVAKDPAHNKFWYAPFGDPVMLYANTTLKPFDDKRVRKALSMAIDRQRIVKEAMNGYAPMLDASGLSDDADLRWKDFAVVRKGTWARYDPAGAKAALDAAGLPLGQHGQRQARGGAPLRFSIDVVEGWTDWVAAAGIIAENLTAVGVGAEVRPLPHPLYISKLQRGEFELAIGSGPRGPTPYTFYRAQMGSALVRPVGTPSAENWHRFGSKDADALLNRFEAARNEDEGKLLMSKLQESFVENAPTLPLFMGPAWGEFSEARFTGFPSATNPYARLSPYSVERLIVMMELKPSSAAAGR